MRPAGRWARSAGRRGLVVAAMAAALGACSVAGPRPGDRDEPVPMPADGTEPDVRVGLVVDVSELVVDGTGPLELVDDGGRVRATGAGLWTVRRGPGGGLEATGSGETLRVGGPLIARPAGNGRVRVDGTSYRGAVMVRQAASGVTAVNLLDMETYLEGVVPLEIGGGRPAEELEAVKAQAIAARTYAVRHMGRREALGFDFYGSVMDQAYGGADAEDPVTSRAVAETRGEVIVYEGQPIEAFYHSTCGGRTAALEEVWNGEPRPYLRSVSDRRPDGGWYCESSNRFRWEESWDQGELVATLSRGLESHGVGPINRVESMEVTDRTRSGRVETLRIVTDRGTHEIHGDSVRWILRPAPNRILNSSAIEVKPSGSGTVTHLEVEGAGWGHGIGMCQIGALGRARDGHSYREILLTYYPGTRIARLYR